MNQRQATNLEEANRQIAELCGTVTELQSQVAWLKRQLFGRKSERYTLPGDSKQPGLFGDDAASTDSAGSPPPPDKQTVTYERDASPSNGRGKRLPIPADLPRVERVHDLPADERAGMKRIGEEVSERIEYEPGKVYVLRDVRIKYARQAQCLDGSEPNMALASKPDEGLPKCIAGPSLLAHIAVSKHADHQPLHRLERILKRSGVSLARPSMCRWMQELAELCAPLLGLMKDRLLQSHVIGADETPVKQQSRGGRGSNRTCYFWSYVGDNTSGASGGSGGYVLYDYQQTRSRAGPNGWFSGEDGEPLYRGLLQCDAYTGYDELFSPPWGMTHVGCWAHARRKFYDVRAQFPGACHHVLAQIRALYDVEREARDLDASQRWALRQERSRPIVDGLFTWCRDRQRPGTASTVLPKSGLGEAIGYMLNQADALRRYLDDGRLAIDNNRCERSLRGIAIGRRNWLFTGSHAGGHAAAAMFSLISSAQRHGAEPLSYLTDLFTRLPATPLSQIDQFLPDRWQANQS